MSDTTQEIAPYAFHVEKIDGSDSIEQVTEKVWMLECFTLWAKRRREELEQQLTDWIRKNGPVTVGDTLYYLGTTKKAPKCVNVAQAMEALAEAAMGDWSKVVECLSSNALKYGACRAILPPEKYAELFIIEQHKELKKDAAPPERTLQKANSEFCKPTKEKTTNGGG